jgi:hypothetical protein
MRFALTPGYLLSVPSALVQIRELFQGAGV